MEKGGGGEERLAGVVQVTFGCVFFVLQKKNIVGSNPTCTGKKEMQI